MEPFLTEPPQGLRDLCFAVVDLETSGGTPKGYWDRHERFQPAAEITEVGVVTLSGPVVEGRFQRLCAIEGALPRAIQALTGITPRTLAGAPAWARVAFELATVMEGRVWVAHHAPFDGSFLKAYLPEGLWGRHRLVCTRLLVKALAPELPRRSLAECCAHFGIVNTRAHRALSDAEATAELLQLLMARAEERGLDAEGFLSLGEVAWKKL
ncbi:MAG TPA: 3'-5' exonuclease [Holophagaceae bacterium]|jgi:DNA polymerase III epsilon subunit-like protein|nr:3'-5' exonuclease [Holophagaceae bacterium]